MKTKRGISAKFRLTAWFTLMVMILAVMVLVFVLVINRSAVSSDPAGRLVNTVRRNVDEVEFDRGRFEWDDLDFSRRGVYCLFFSAEGEQLAGAWPEGVPSDLPFMADTVRIVDANGQNYYLYDSYVDMDVTGLWIRGTVSEADRSGVMHTVLVLTFTLLPALLLLTVAGGWLIASDAFRPMEEILSAADSISDGHDLTARLALDHGPSEMRRLSRVLDRMLGRLEGSFHTEQQFASDASHELRTPITVILAECDRARRKAQTREDFLSSLDVIEEQGQRMSGLTQQLLDLTRMHHRTDSYRLQEAELSALVESCCAEFIPEKERGIRLITEISPAVRAVFNPTLMSRILQNLLQNAYRYGRDGGCVKLSLRREARGAVLQVADDGIGIAPEDQDKIWLRFWQSESARSDGEGSGLGLAMVKEMAEFQGGSVSVESELGKGSVFTVILP